MGKTIDVTLKVWRQNNPKAKGRFETYEAKNVDTDVSFLEMLDIVNADLELRGIEPIAFDSDCREGICGTCGAMTNGAAHGPERGTTLCQLHMRHFKNGETIVIEPWRSKAFPVIKDLMVDRSSFDRIVATGAFISVRTGSAPEAHSFLVPKEEADAAFEAAQCIGCGACVAACPNGSAMLYVAAKVDHFSRLPQGQPERAARVQALVRQMDAEGFGNCSNFYYCEAACPKNISVKSIARMNRDYLASSLRGRRKPAPESV